MYIPAPSLVRLLPLLNDPRTFLSMEQDINDGERDLAGQQWAWKLDIEETEEQNIFKASIDVYLPEDNEKSLSSLTTYFSRYQRSAETFEAGQ